MCLCVHIILGQEQVYCIISVKETNTQLSKEMVSQKVKDVTQEQSQQQQTFTDEPLWAEYSQPGLLPSFHEDRGSGHEADSDFERRRLQIHPLHPTVDCPAELHRWLMMRFYYFLFIVHRNGAMD